MPWFHVEKSMVEKWMWIGFVLKFGANFRHSLWNPSSIKLCLQYLATKDILYPHHSINMNLWIFQCRLEWVNKMLDVLLLQDCVVSQRTWKKCRWWRQYWTCPDGYSSLIGPAVCEFTSWSSRAWQRQCPRVRGTTNLRRSMWSLHW